MSFDLVVQATADCYRDCRIRQADVRVCVLSLPELERGGGSVPEMVAEFITPQTLVLLNKRDLALAADRRQCEKHAWEASIVEKSGMEEFVQGLGVQVRER